jgi:hypothetical protein
MSRRPGASPRTVNKPTGSSCARSSASAAWRRRSRCRTTRPGPPIGGQSPSAPGSTSTRQKRSKRSPVRWLAAVTATQTAPQRAQPRPPRERTRTAKTPSLYAWPRTPACAAASSSRSAGATSTSSGASSSCAARLAATSRRARRSRDGRARYRSPTRRPERSPASRSAATHGCRRLRVCSRLGRRLDGSALRRRVERARDAAGLRALRFHDLRHTYGSLLVAGGVDLASVKAAMGHSRITTTERYLHARSAGELADRFTRALAGSDSAMPPAPEVAASR